MPADGFKVRKERSAEHEVGSESPEQGKLEMDDLWLQLKRQTEDMENHIRRLAAEADAAALEAADGSHAPQGLEVFESVGVQNEEVTPNDGKTKEPPLAMPAAEHPLVPAVEQQPAQLKRYLLAKQSGVRDIYWCTQAFGWKVQFPKVDCKGNFISWTSREFRVKKFMVSGGTEVEADAAALEAAMAFRTELVEKGILSEPKLKDPEFTSEVLGVSWGKKEKKWKVLLCPNKRKRIYAGCFTEKAAAEAKALELQEKNGMQLQVKPVPALANRYAGLPVFHPKVPYRGVTWDLQKQKWRASCCVGGVCREFRVKPKDHSEVELERSFNAAVRWRKKHEKEKKGKVVKPKAKAGKNQ